jgi:hypothetical protein
MTMKFHRRLGAEVKKKILAPRKGWILQHDTTTIIENVPTQYQHEPSEVSL